MMNRIRHAQRHLISNNAGKIEVIGNGWEAIENAGILKSIIEGLGCKKVTILENVLDSDIPEKPRIFNYEIYGYYEVSYSRKQRDAGTPLSRDEADMNAMMTNVLRLQLDNVPRVILVQQSQEHPLCAEDIPDLATRFATELKDYMRSDYDLLAVIDDLRRERDRRLVYPGLVASRNNPTLQTTADRLERVRQNWVLRQQMPWVSEEHIKQEEQLLLAN